MTMVTIYGAMDVWEFSHMFHVSANTLTQYVALVNSLPCF